MPAVLFRKKFLLAAFLIVLAAILSARKVAIVFSGNTGPQDSLTYNPQYYLLQKALTDSAYRDSTDKIWINMKRWQAMPSCPGKRFLWVNIPDFSLKVIENDTVRMTMKAIVGTPYRQTPVFRAKVSHVIFNPSWNIPPTILKNDILPLVLQDTSYLRKKHIKIFKIQKGERREIPADSVDWAAISPDHFPYELVQDPGKDNALGAVKFIFPNPYNVYLHDTPARELFEQNERTFSSGCIRISNAVGLAEYLLKGKWSRNRILKAIQNGETITADLPAPVDVYIQYFTAWADSCGDIQFRKDIYGRDSVPQRYY